MKLFRALFFLLIFPTCTQVFATHIVGGEFELIHKSDYLFTLKLILYFDHIHGDPGADDSQLQPHIFRKKDNSYVFSPNLLRISSEFVPYTNPECRSNPEVELETRKIVYSTDIFLDPSEFDDPQGYYVIWERCCRNIIINNIEEPEHTGQTFYLEFPPVVKNGAPFVNSTPILFPPLSDYAVVNQLYYVDFRGTDTDGDSLVYSMEVPLRGNSSQIAPVPAIMPAPYPLVTWADGISLSNVIPGSRPLKIDSTGFLTVIPGQTGLYVFSVKCQEFRDGVKLGEVVRDFQLLVVDVEVGQKPELRAKIPGSDSFYKESEIIRFSTTDPKCFELLVTDKDGRENIKLKAIPVNFSENANSILSVNQGFISDAEDTLRVDVCFTDCPFKIGEPFFIDFVAMDDACSLPLMDTLRVGVQYEPRPNQNPKFTQPVANLSQNVPIETKYQLAIKGTDADGDHMYLEIVPEGFLPEEYGISITEVKNQPGNYEALLEFNADCDVYNFLEKTDFKIDLMLKDINGCHSQTPEVLTVDLKVVFPPNTKPKVSAELTRTTLDVFYGDKVNFRVSANDADNDYLRLVGIGEDFNFKDYGMRFENKEGTGSLSSIFLWEPTCKNAGLRESFLLYFIADDIHKCRNGEADTLMITINLNERVNSAPVVSINDLSASEISITAGNTIEFDLVGFDNDKDSVYLSLLQAPPIENLKYEFDPAIGEGRVSSRFTLYSDCDLFKENPELSDLQFKFIVTDIRCKNALSDTLTLVVNIEDLEYDYNSYLPANVFTPNDDQVNDYYELENLPPDNCINQYLGIFIYNRWGKLVFSDHRRDFKWSGDGLATGVYYYVISYTNKEYKGTVSILY